MSEDNKNTIYHVIGRIIIILIFVTISLVIDRCFGATVNKDSVYTYARSIGVRYPKLCVAQAIHETGDFTSYGCRSRHNLFGFRSRYSYRRFCDWKESVNYYKTWQDRRTLHHNTTTYKRWFQYVSTHFATDRHYGRKLSRVIKRNHYPLSTQLTNIDPINSLTVASL